LEIPGIDKNSSPLWLHALAKGFLQIGQRWTRELPGFSQVLHRPISHPRRNERNRAGPARESNSGGFRNPLQSFLSSDERRVHEQKNAQRNSVVSQEIGRGRKLVEIKFLVQPFECFRVGRLQPHRDFQRSLEQIAKIQSAFSY